MKPMCFHYVDMTQHGKKFIFTLFKVKGTTQLGFRSSDANFIKQQMTKLNLPNQELERTVKTPTD